MARAGAEPGGVKADTLVLMSIQQANKKQVRIFTDGSCDTGSREGGWGYLLICGAARKTASGYEADTTNNRMELSAAVKALEALTRTLRGHLSDRLAIS